MTSAPGNYIPHQDYHDGMQKPAEKAKCSYITTPVPSKAWYQDQEENAKRRTSSVMDDDDDFKPIPVVHPLWNYIYQDYHNGMRKPAEKAKYSYKTTSTPSKAWYQDQEERAKRRTSSVMDDDDDDFKPIPVVNKLPDMSKAPLNKPLKSAMKKTPSTKKEELEPLFNARECGDTTAYFSENYTVRPYKVTKGPSKAYLEEQQEKLEELTKKHEAAWHPPSRS